VRIYRISSTKLSGTTSLNLSELFIFFLVNARFHKKFHQTAPPFLRIIIQFKAAESGKSPHDVIEFMYQNGNIPAVDLHYNLDLAFELRSFGGFSVPHTVGMKLLKVVLKSISVSFCKSFCQRRRASPYPHIKLPVGG
jgi:hypothetical protein